MPIRISDNLPAAKVLESENVFVMTENRAVHQDIRPLKIVILNLMPNKVETETQLLRLLGNTPLQVDIDLMQTATHTSRNTSKEHLLEFYQTFEQLQNHRYDGMIITGAPSKISILPQWITGLSSARLWTGHAPMYIQPCIYAGGLRRDFSSITVSPNIRFLLKCPAFFGIGLSIPTTLFCVGSMSIFTCRIPAIPRSRRRT